MKDLTKSFLRAAFPIAASYLAAYRTRRHIAGIWGSFQLEFARRLYGKRSPVVLSGPFEGMQYINDIVHGCITPKWLGSYEAELHPVIEEIISRGYHTVIDVGAAEGYYLIGLARRMPGSILYGFDINPLARRQQTRLCSLNGQENVQIGGYCSPGWLKTHCKPGSLVICDIEGYELYLLSPKIVPLLKEADILVELHPFAPMSYPEVRRTIIDRFEATHTIQRIAAQQKDEHFYNAVAGGLFSAEEMKEALNEGRFTGQEWLWMRSK
ncbi:MAG: hypothetical protein ICV83_32270 [Cytophagales bacterium]|nr:hypothetical protein [Cytophagales bacterium]